MDWRTSLITELTGFGQSRAISADWAALVDAWRGAYKPSMDRVRQGALPWTSLDDLHRASLDRLLDQFGIAGITEPDRHWMTFGWHRLHPWPDSVPGLVRLHRTFILGPLSNGNVSLLVDLARHNGLPWDMIFGSDVFRHFKPDPETYLGACRLLGLPPSAVMLCAAHNDDLAAARSHGLRTAFVPRPTEYGPAQVKDTEPTGPWDMVVRDLVDMAAQLGC